MTGKKLVNRYCATRKTVLGDKYLTTSFETKVDKDNHVAAYDNKKKNDKKKFKGKTIPANAASVIKNPNITKVVPKETINRLNLTGIGPAFLYKEKEVCTIKKLYP